VIQHGHLKYVLFIFLSFFLLWTVPIDAFAKGTVFKIATGEYMGRYFPTGGTIAEIVNNRQEENGFRCIVEPTSGSVFNINAMMAGDMAFGIVQSDIQYQAFNGEDEWKDKGLQKDLRAMFSLYTESVTLVASVDSGIKTIQNLKGKRIDIGKEGSGGRQNAIDALNAAGIDWTTDLRLIEIEKNTDAESMLMRGDLDAFFYTVGHPTTAIKFVTVGAKKTIFVPMINIEKLLSKYPYYVKSIIPVSLYPHHR
jgi:TRAP transporter TAXI family solute receptor